MYRVHLKKIESTHQNLRTNEVDGLCQDLPEVGSSFVMIAESLTEGASHRQIITSQIQEVRHVGDEIVFKTHNSLYSLKINTSVAH